MGKQILTAHFLSSHSFCKVYFHAILYKWNALFIVPWWSPPCEVYSACFPYETENVRQGNKKWGGRREAWLFPMGDGRFVYMSLVQIPAWWSSSMLLTPSSYPDASLGHYELHHWFLKQLFLWPGGLMSLFRTFLIWDAENKKKKKDQHYPALYRTLGENLRD